MTELNFHQLRIFYMVAQRRSFSRAARELKISQPAVSAQVRQFEEDLQLVLIDRSRHRVGLTDAGRTVVNYAERIFGMSDELVARLGALRDPPHAQLVMGASPTIGEYVMPRFLARYRRAHPAVDLQLEIGPTRSIVDCLLNDEIGLGFVGDEVTAPDVASYPFAIDELVPVISPGHPLAGATSLTAKELSGLDFIMRHQGSSTRRAAEARLAELGIAPHVAIELGTNEAVKQAVMANLGVAILSRWAVRFEVATGQLATICPDTLTCSRRFQAIVRKSRQLTDVQRAFLDLLQELDDTEIAS